MVRSEGVTMTCEKIIGFDVFNLKPTKDLFYAMSHGVNRATLKEGTEYDRIIFLNKLITLHIQTNV